MAIAGATGISQGAAYDVPGLLMPKAEAFDVRNLKEPTLMEVEQEGRPFYRIKAGYGSVLVEIWIDRETGLIGRIDWDMDSLKTSRIYTPEMDTEVTQEELNCTMLRPPRL